MNLLDVNVLVYTHRRELVHHDRVAAFVQELVDGSQTFGVPYTVFQSVVRIVTQPAFDPPSTPGQALDFCGQIMSAPNCRVVHPSESHWEVFDGLCRRVDARRNIVADAFLAAFALDRGDVWVTADAGFARFPGLQWRFPWDVEVRRNPG